MALKTIIGDNFVRSDGSSVSYEDGLPAGTVIGILFTAVRKIANSGSRLCQSNGIISMVKIYEFDA